MSDMPVEPEQLRSAVTHEVRQQMTPFLLKLDRVVEDAKQLRWTVYGDAAIGADGMVSTMKDIQKKMGVLIDQNEARDNQWKGIRAALVVVGALSSVPALQALGKLIGIIP